MLSRSVGYCDVEAVSQLPSQILRRKASGACGLVQCCLSGFFLRPFFPRTARGHRGSVNTKRLANRAACHLFDAFAAEQSPVQRSTSKQHFFHRCVHGRLAEDRTL